MSRRSGSSGAIASIRSKRRRISWWCSKRTSSALRAPGGGARHLHLGRLPDLLGRQRFVARLGHAAHFDGAIAQAHLVAGLRRGSGSIEDAAAREAVARAVPRADETAVLHPALVERTAHMRAARAHRVDAAAVAAPARCRHGRGPPRPTPRRAAACPPRGRPGRQPAESSAARASGRRDRPPRAAGRRGARRDRRRPSRPASPRR